VEVRNFNHGIHGKGKFGKSVLSMVKIVFEADDLFSLADDIKSQGRQMLVSRNGGQR
jgi:hypothetical protein